MTTPKSKSPASAGSRLKAQREDIFTGKPETTPPPAETPAPKTSVKKTVSFQADPELLDRARAAVLISQSHPDGYRSLASFMAAAIEAKLEDAAEQFNGGERIEPISGTFRAGRPIQN